MQGTPRRKEPATVQAAPGYIVWQSGAQSPPDNRLLVERVLKSLGRLEARASGCSYVNALTCSRIAPFASRAILHGKGTKALQSHLLGLLQRSGYSSNHAVKRPLCICLVQVCRLCDGIYHFTLVHAHSLRIRKNQTPPVSPSEHNCQPDRMHSINICPMRCNSISVCPFCQSVRRRSCIFGIGFTH